jgi:hypothetical protein
VKIAYNAQHAIPAMLKLQDFIMNPKVNGFVLRNTDGNSTQSRFV